MRWITLFLVVTSLSLLSCREPPKRDNKKPSKAPPPRLTLSQAQYEAEIAALRERIQRGEDRQHKWPIINTHEHLLKAKHLPNYIAAARKIGVAQTIVVTSTRFTLYGKGNKTYETMGPNWLNVRKAARDYPGEILPFAAVDPTDPDKLKHLQKMVAEGALGVKLYSGHSNLYDKPLNDPGMDEIYAYLEKTQLPMNWHINLGKYSKDFEAVMEKYPKLNVMIPHYGVAFWRYQRIDNLSRLMRKYPNILVDTSLGTREILVDGMYTVAEPAAYAKFQTFLDEFQDQIVYGSDSVITGNKEKTPNWYYLVLAATMDHLSEDTFVFPLGEAYARYHKPGRDPAGRIKGFNLSDAALKKIYVDNPRKWLGKYKAPPPPPKIGEITSLPAQPEAPASGGEGTKQP